MTRRLVCAAALALGLALVLVDGRFAAEEGALVFRWSLAGRVLWEGDRAALFGVFGPSAPHLAAAAVAAVLAGLALARGLRELPGRRGAAAVAGALLAFPALDPALAAFVAERSGTSAPWYLDLGDRALGLGLGLAALAWAFRAPGGAARELAAAPPKRATRATRATRAARERALVAAACALAALAPALLSRAFLDGEPVTNDGRAYLWQAELFARGELAREPGDLADFFPARQVLPGPRALSKYPPGYSALLAPGVALGLPELLPRLLAGLVPLLAYRIARRLACPRPHRAALLCALSPMVLGVETLWLSHSLSLPACALFAERALAARDARERGEGGASARALAAGAALSVAFLARPVTALAFGLGLAPLLVGTPALAAAAAVGALPGVALFLAHGAAATGSPWRTAYGLYADVVSPNDRFGLANLGTAAELTRFNLARLAVWLHGAAGGLLLAVAGVLAPRAGRPRRALLLAAPAVALAAAYALHRFQGVPWVGPLYLVEAVPLLCVLSAAGLAALERARGAGAVLGVLVVLAVGSPALLARHLTVARAEVLLREAPRLAARAQGVERGVVFVPVADEEDAKRRSLPPPELVAPLPPGRLVYARDLGERNAVLLRRLGDPPAWRFRPREGDLVPLP